MPLKIELKPHESIIIGGAIITNENNRSRFYIDGDVPILREKFILREKDADTPAKRIYFVVQQLYLTGGNKEFQKLFIEYMRDLQTAAPSLRPSLTPVAEAVLVGDYYGAIKSAGKLIEMETALFGETLNPVSLPSEEG